MAAQLNRGGETAVHARLKRLSMIWAQARGYSACALEVHLPHGLACFEVLDLVLDAGAVHDRLAVDVGGREPDAALDPVAGHVLDHDVCVVRRFDVGAGDPRGRGRGRRIG